MLLRSIVVLVIYFASLSAVPMIVYNDARFDPTNVQTHLINIFSITTRNTCACQCFANSSCITSTFIGINQTCILFSASLSQGQVRVTINSNASVISFPNRTTNTDSSNLPAIIEWLFDGDFNDVYGLYNGNLTGGNTALWISPGYNGYGQAVYLESKNYSFIDNYLNLTATSFTISAWIWIPYGIPLSNSDYFILFGHCEYRLQDMCLHVGTMNDKIYFGFFGDDLPGYTTINFDQWNHVAYVYDRANSEQLIYLNGKQDANRTCYGPYTGNASYLTIGAVPEFMEWVQFRTGYIDNLTFVSRIKNDSELLAEATLVAYYSFDNTYLDFGPNQINNSSGINTNFDSTGRFNQALVIGSMYPSYFQTIGFYYLGQTNYSYSFSIWIYPYQKNGTILQVSSPNGWCVPMIGFNNTGHLTIQTLGSNSIYATSLINDTLQLNTWTHISMTYSTTNGIQLYVNGSLANINNASTYYLASGEFCTIIVGTCSQPNICAVNQTKIVPAQFLGKIDELKVFSRELSASEIFNLALS